MVVGTVFLKLFFAGFLRFFPPPTWHKWWPELPFRTSCKNGRMCALGLNQPVNLKYSSKFLFCNVSSFFCVQVLLRFYEIWLQIWGDYRISAKGSRDIAAKIYLSKFSLRICCKKHNNLFKINFRKLGLTWTISFNASNRQQYFATMHHKKR